MPGDGAGHRQHILQVGGAVLVRRRADRDELVHAVGHAFGGIGGEAQAAFGGVLQHQFGQARFIDGNLPLAQARHLVGVDVHTQDVVADVGEAGSGDQSDVAGAENGDIHERLMVWISSA